MIVLGIDPGTAATGFALILYKSSRLRVLDFGVIRTNSKDLLQHRIKTVYDGISEILDKYRPDLMSIEKVFVNKNPKAALTIGHTRGAIMLAAANRNIPISEYASRAVKLAAAGYGGASKEQVGRMIRQVLSLRKDLNIPEDAADALAIAYTGIVRI